MDLYLHLSWWAIPTVITACSIFWAIFIVDGGSGIFSGLDNMFAMIPALAISCISWIVAAIFK